MQTINYEYTVNQKIQKTVEIEDENFICILQWRDGANYFTALIKEKNRKFKIETTPSGNFLNFERMAGSPELNAIKLLQKDKKNRVVSRTEFLNCFKQQNLSWQKVINFIKQLAVAENSRK